jgi:hypothetical protein
MNAARRTALVAAALAAAGTVAYLGIRQMGFFSSTERDLRRLLGPGGELADDARIAGHAPDPNYKARTFYLLRRLDEAAFRDLAQRVGLGVAPTPKTADAVWRLPEGVVLPGWSAADVPAGTGLQANGNVGSAAVWLRWHQGSAYIVALAVGP